MHQQTQSQNIKVCNSCRRTLHTSLFGINSKSKDGFNSCCKECRNYRRRRSYHNSTDLEQIVFPLNENNQRVIEFHLKNFLQREIPALNSRNEHVFFKIILNPDGSLEFNFRDGIQRYITKAVA